VKCLCRRRAMIQRSAESTPASTLALSSTVNYSGWQ
jgi:hypothetical protein